MLINVYIPFFNILSKNNNFENKKSKKLLLVSIACITFPIFSFFKFTNSFYNGKFHFAKSDMSPCVFIFFMYFYFTEIMPTNIMIRRIYYYSQSFATNNSPFVEFFHKIHLFNNQLVGLELSKLPTYFFAFN